MINKNNLFGSENNFNQPKPAFANKIIIKKEYLQAIRQNMSKLSLILF